MTAAVAFYRSMGSGLFGLYRAFHWSGDALAPVADVDPQTLGALIDYEEQKDAARNLSEQHRSYRRLSDKRV